MLDDIDDLKKAEAERREELELRLTEFFYLLIRNHLPSGVVVEVIQEVEKGAYGDGNFTIAFTSKGLAIHSRQLARRVLGLKSEHSFKQLQMPPGCSTIVESCWRCGTLRTSEGDLPQDGYEYFPPGEPFELEGKWPKGKAEEPKCLEGV